LHARRRAAAPPPRGPRAPRAHGLGLRVRALGRGLRRSRRAGARVRDHGVVSDGILILLRHGESVFNAASIFTGLLDVDVSERGREQARAAGRLIAASGLTPETIWTSPMRRAAVTTDLVCAELGIDPASARSTW